MNYASDAPSENRFKSWQATQQGRQDQIARRRPEVSILYHARGNKLQENVPTPLIIDSGPEFPMLALNYGVRIYFPKNESDAPSENGTELWSQDLLSEE